MDALFFHPKMVHLPIALGVLMPLVASALTAAWWRKWLPARAFALAVGLQALLVVSGVAALRSGEAEEDRVEQVVAERFIEQHEEAAEVFVVASGLVLGIMVLGLAMSRTRFGLPVASIAVVGTVVVLGLGYRTGQAGGELVYRHGAAGAYAGSAPAPPAPTGSHHEREDDD